MCVVILYGIKHADSQCATAYYLTFLGGWLSDFSTGFPGRCGPTEVLHPERSAGSFAQRHVVQQQPVQTAHSLRLLVAAPTDRPLLKWANQHLFCSICMWELCLTSMDTNILQSRCWSCPVSAGFGRCHVPRNQTAIDTSQKFSDNYPFFKFFFPKLLMGTFLCAHLAARKLVLVIEPQNFAFMCLFSCLSIK